MTYKRVIPRDLFNEASLLKCMGRLWILTERFNSVEWSQGDGAFNIDQCPYDGSISVLNVSMRINGAHCSLRRPLNSRDPWPLWAALANSDDDEWPVFTDDGELSPEMLEAING